jgi:AbrB family looped-hinge helix DNA binding protein
MSTQLLSSQQEWLKILDKGMVTLPKKWRDQLGIQKGNVVMAKKVANKIIIQSQETAPYRIYSQKELQKFLAEDKIAG